MPAEGAGGAQDWRQVQFPGKDSLNLLGVVAGEELILAAWPPDHGPPRLCGSRDRACVESWLLGPAWPSRDGKCPASENTAHWWLSWLQRHGLPGVNQTCRLHLPFSKGSYHSWGHGGLWKADKGDEPSPQETTHTHVDARIYQNTRSSWTPGWNLNPGPNPPPCPSLAPSAHHAGAFLPPLPGLLPLFRNKEF